jgi:nucleotide-binding universal stress UspA family protein
MYTHILVPTDGSELAQKGVDHALSLAKGLGSKVTVITVTPPFPRVYGSGWVPSDTDMERYDAENKKAAEALLGAVRASAERLGITPDTVHATSTSPATAIVEESERVGANLIVMSSHGRRGIARMLVGSQTSEVLANSNLPVLVVR